MNKKLLVTACLLAMIALLISYQAVPAHEHIYKNFKERLLKQLCTLVGQEMRQ